MSSFAPNLEFEDADVTPVERSGDTIRAPQSIDAESMQAAAVASNYAQLKALEAVLEGVKKLDVELRRVRRLMLALVGIATLSTSVGGLALYRGEKLEQRVRATEETLIRIELKLEGENRGN